MKKLWPALLVVPFLFVIFPTKSQIIKRAHLCTHDTYATVQKTADIPVNGTPLPIQFDDDVKCSATAIGPHALLTAEHCEVSSNDIQINGKDFHILGRLHDGDDHSILLVDATFWYWAEISTKPHEIGDRVFGFGNPGALLDIYREGYFVGILHPADDPDDHFKFDSFLYDINEFPGDSGSALFNQSGKIEDVVNMMVVQNDPRNVGAAIKLFVAFPLQFTATQIRVATAFQPPKVKQ